MAVLPESCTAVAQAMGRAQHSPRVTTCGMPNLFQAHCACGRVEFEAKGDPLAAVACYCDDCQAAARQIRRATRRSQRHRPRRRHRQHAVSQGPAALHAWGRTTGEAQAAPGLPRHAHARVLLQQQHDDAVRELVTDGRTAHALGERRRGQARVVHQHGVCTGQDEDDAERSAPREDPAAPLAQGGWGSRLSRADGVQPLAARSFDLNARSPTRARARTCVAPVRPPAFLRARARRAARR